MNIVDILNSASMNIGIANVWQESGNGLEWPLGV